MVAITRESDSSSSDHVRNLCASLCDLISLYWPSLSPLSAASTLNVNTVGAGGVTAAESTGRNSDLMLLLA